MRDRAQQSRSISRGRRPVDKGFMALRIRGRLENSNVSLAFWRKRSKLTGGGWLGSRTISGRGGGGGGPETQGGGGGGPPGGPRHMGVTFFFGLSETTLIEPLSLSLL